MNRARTIPYSLIAVGLCAFAIELASNHYHPPLRANTKETPLITDSISSSELSDDPQTISNESNSDIYNKVSLVAIFKSEKKDHSVAFVKISKAPASTFRPGDHLTEGVTLSKIMENSILVELNDYNKSIEISLQASNDEILKLAPLEIEEELAHHDEHGDYYKEHDISKINYQHGTAYLIGEGFFPINDEHAYLRPKDKITSINGYPAGETDIFNLLKSSFEATGRLEMTVVRDSTEIIISFPSLADNI